MTTSHSTRTSSVAAAAPERDYTDGITPDIVAPRAAGWRVTSTYAYCYEPRAARGALLNGDAYEAAERELLEGTEVIIFVHACKSCREELLVVRGDYDDGSAMLFAFEHAGSDWVHAPVPGAIAVAHAAVRTGTVDTPLGVIGGSHCHS